MRSTARFHYLSRPEPHVDEPWLVATVLAYAAVLVAATPPCDADGFEPWLALTGLYVIACGAFAWRAPRRWVVAAMGHAPAAVTGGVIVAGAFITLRDLVITCPPADSAMVFCAIWGCEPGYDEILTPIVSLLLAMAVLAPVIGWPVRVAKTALRRPAG